MNIKKQEVLKSDRMKELKRCHRLDLMIYRVLEELV